MAVPKRKTSGPKQGMRRSHHARKPFNLIACPRCQNLVPAHTACPNCGTYRGRNVIDVVAKLNKEERKAKTKAHTHG